MLTCYKLFNIYFIIHYSTREHSGSAYIPRHYANKTGSLVVRCCVSHEMSRKTNFGRAAACSLMEQSII